MTLQPARKADSINALTGKMSRLRLRWIKIVPMQRLKRAVIEPQLVGSGEMNGGSDLKRHGL